MTKGTPFKPAIIANLPKDVSFLASAEDGAYVLLQECVEKRMSAYDRHKLRRLTAGSVIVSTEGGHLYVLDESGGLKGLGKSTNRQSAYGHALVQRVTLGFQLFEYKKPPARRKTKRKVTKKKAKKKVVKQKAARRY